MTEVFANCWTCMGSGYGGHPDSGAVCADCGGAGGTLVADLAPDAAPVRVENDSQGDSKVLE